MPFVISAMSILHSRAMQRVTRIARVSNVCASSSLRGGIELPDAGDSRPEGRAIIAAGRKLQEAVIASIVMTVKALSTQRKSNTQQNLGDAVRSSLKRPMAAENQAGTIAKKLRDVWRFHWALSRCVPEHRNMGMKCACRKSMPEINLSYANVKYELDGCQAIYAVRGLRTRRCMPKIWRER